MKLYDIFVYTDPVYFLSKEQDGFVFVDQVFVGKLLRLLLKNNNIPEDAIDRMLLANLWYKRIVENINNCKFQALFDTHQAVDSWTGSQKKSDICETYLRISLMICKEKNKKRRITAGVSHQSTDTFANSWTVMLE